MKVDKKYEGKFQNFRSAELKIVNDRESNNEKALRISSRITASSMEKNFVKDDRPIILPNFHKLQFFSGSKITEKPDFEIEIFEQLHQEHPRPIARVTDAVVVASLNLNLKGKIVAHYEKMRPAVVQLVFIDKEGLIAEIIEVHPAHR